MQDRLRQKLPHARGGYPGGGGGGGVDWVASHRPLEQPRKKHK